MLAKNEATPKRTPPPVPNPTPGRKVAPVNPNAIKTDSPEELAARKAAIADAINSAGGTGGSSASGGAGTSGGGKTNGSGGNTATILGVYNDMIHDRFYSEWDQPTVAGGVPAGTMGVLLKIRVEKDGTISKSSLSSASGLPAMDNSVLAVPAKVGKIEPPPLEVLGKRPFYEVSIKFDRK